MSYKLVPLCGKIFTKKNFSNQCVNFDFDVALPIKDSNQSGLPLQTKQSSIVRAIPFMKAIEFEAFLLNDPSAHR
jgi:hypothetical protein